MTTMQCIVTERVSEWYSERFDGEESRGAIVDLGRCARVPRDERAARAGAVRLLREVLLARVVVVRRRALLERADLWPVPARNLVQRLLQHRARLLHGLAPDEPADELDANVAPVHALLGGVRGAGAVVGRDRVEREDGQRPQDRALRDGRDDVDEVAALER